MNGISHKQAIQLIYRRMDGMLNEDQRLQLDEHLRSCDSCQAHAAEMDGLSAHLQNEFHRRWDGNGGPSQGVLKHVTNQASKFPIRNRITTGAKLLAGALALITLAFAINFVVSQLQSIVPATNSTETVNPVTETAENPLLAFESDENGNADIYTMHANGSVRTNVTNNSAYDGNPFWSPDGKRIAFVSDRDGFKQVYLMNADGSEMTQLTHDEANHFLPVNLHGESNPWSPDGTRLLFLQQELEAEVSTLYVLDIDSGKAVRLTDGNAPFNNLSWSPDGKYIGYVLNISPAPDARFETGLYVINATGSNLIPIHQLVPEPDRIDNPAYHWSRDGSSIIFIAYRHLDEGKDQWIAYEAILESHQLIERAISSTRMQDWWEGTSFVSGNTAVLTWLRSDNTFNTFKPLEACQSPGDGPYGFYAKRSPHGSQVINISCPNDVMWFYYANADGTIIKPLMGSPIPSITADHSVTAMTWSPDDRFVAATLVSPTKSSFYILNVNQPAAEPQEIVISDRELYAVPAWQPVGDNEIVEQEPTPEPKSTRNGLLAFTSDQSGNLDIYTMYADGTGLTNLTNDPAQDSNPIWSPDGKHIAFQRYSNGFTQIYRMDADGSNLMQLTDDQADHGLSLNFDGKSNPWSPDGEKLLILESSSGDIWHLYVMGIDGENKILLASGRFSLNNFSWSPDGKHIVYVLNEASNPDQTFDAGIYVVTPDGTNSQELRSYIPPGESLGTHYWSQDGQSVVFMAQTSEYAKQHIIYEFHLGTNTLRKKDTLPRPVIDWQNDISLTWGKDFVWYRSDGTTNTLAWNGSDCSVDFTRSSHGNFAIGAYCTDNPTFKLYWTNKDGSVIQQLLDSPQTPSMGEIGDIVWSSDDQYIAFTIAADQSSLYILNVKDALNNPSLAPQKMVIGSPDLLYAIPAWQPVGNNEIVEEGPTPVPPASDRLIAFTSPENGPLDIFVMRSDGSGVQNITNNPASDRNPVWSPDGTKLAFESDRNGKFDVFVMSADGSNLTQITSELAYDVLANSYDSPWSPDGTQLVIQSNISGHEALFVVSADGQGEPVQISDTPGFVTWSPTGEQIVYSYISEKSELNNTGEYDAIRIVNADGSRGQNIIQTSLIRYVKWSPDGKMLYYLSAGEPFAWDVQRVNLEGNTTETILSFGDEYEPGMAWFSPDSTIVYASRDSQGDLSTFYYRLRNGNSSVVGQLPDKSKICGTSAVGYAIVSHDTAQAISYIPCDSGEIVFTIHDLVNNTSALLGKLSLANPEIYVDWSQDDQLIMIRAVQSDVSLSSGAQVSLYVIPRSPLDQLPVTLTPIIEQTNGLTRTAIQPVPNREIVYAPTSAPEPTQIIEGEPSLPLGTGIGNGEWIAFVGSTMVPDPTGTTALTDSQDVYLIHPDGSGLVNLTNSPDSYLWPAWSPDGNNLLFLRNTGTVQILRRTDANGFEVLVSTGMKAEVEVSSETSSVEQPFHYSWSPNSDQVAFLDQHAGNYDIYTIYADGREDPQLKQLTNDPDQEFRFVWSPDGTQIAYQKTNGDQLSVMVMNTDGSNQHEVARGIGEMDVHWSIDGNSIYANSVYQWPPESMVSHLECEGCIAKPAIYQIDLSEESVHQIYYEEDTSQVDGWYLYDTPQNTLYFMHVKPQSFLGAWGTWFRANSNSVEEVGELDPHQTCKTTTGNILNEHISPNPRFSVISNFCAGGFNLYLADREAPDPDQKLLHLLQLPLDTWGEGGDDATLPVTWSPDGRWLIYNDGRTATYLLDIERAIQDPDAALTTLIEPVYYTGADGLQYQSSETITVQNLVWQPAP